MTTKEQHSQYNRSEKGKARSKRYKDSEHGKIVNKRRDKSIVRKYKWNPSMSAEAQKERKARPEYVLARQLGITVAVAREIINGGAE